MKRCYVLTALLVLALLMLILALTTSSARRYRDYLSGFWVGDPGFLAKAELRDVQLFISPEESGGDRSGYLIMTDQEGKFVSNQAVTVRAGRPGAWQSLRSAFRRSGDVCTAPVEFEYLGGSAPMPASMKLSLSILGGTLTLFDDEKVYAFLAKDNSTSISALEAWKAQGAQ